MFTKLKEFEATNHDTSTCGDAACAAFTEDDSWLMKPYCSTSNNDSSMNFHHSDMFDLSHARDNYERWREIHGEYLENMSDWVKAWEWLQHHPAFWKYAPHSNATSIADAETVKNLVMDQGLEHMSMYPHRNEDGDAVVSLEHGAYAWASDLVNDDPYYDGLTGVPSHDYNIDVEAPTFESAIIALAAKVLVHYGDGAARVERALGDS